MKALLVLLAVAAGVWLWRRGQRVSASAAAAPPKPAGHPQPMLRGARCGVHLPASNAVMGRDDRAYCCPAHRQQAEGG
jgi:uncharacterized protein